MPWFFVDDAFADSRPVMQLDRALRNEAIGLWVRCGAWSAKEETDGHVPLDTVKQFGGTPRLIRALHEQAQLWVECSPDSWRNSREILFGNWEKWQKTRAENQARRKREADKKQTWRAGKKGRDYVASSQNAEMSTGDTMVDEYQDSEFVSTGESRYPDPTRPDPTLLPLETYVGEGTLVDAHGTPRPHCSKHETNSPTEKCPECKARRLWDEANADRLKADELTRKRDEKAAAAAALKNCRMCDEKGWLLGSDGTPVEPAAKCTFHIPAREEASGE